jgi:hypothetical protein
MARHLDEMARHLDEMAGRRRLRPRQQSHFSWASRVELSSAAQPDELGLPIAVSLSEPLEALPGGDHAATPELARAAEAEPTQSTSGTEQPDDVRSATRRTLLAGNDCSATSWRAGSSAATNRHGMEPDSARRTAAASGARKQAARGRQGGTGRCNAHGGGKRCAHEGCNRLARDGTGLCRRHMPRCQADVCTDEPGAELVSCLYAGRLDPESGLKLCRSHKELGLVKSAQALHFLWLPHFPDSISVQQLVARLFSGCPGGELSLHNNLGAKLLLSNTDLAKCGGCLQARAGSQAHGAAEQRPDYTASGAHSRSH